MNFDNFKFRCHYLGDLMTCERGSGITEKQLETIADYETKDKLTDKQRDELNRLIAKKNAPPALGSTAKKKLVEIFASAKYHRRKEIKSKYLEKGSTVEEDSITLIARVKKKVYRKNTERIENSFLSGEPDLFDGESIKKADSITDAKSSWDLFTFFDVLTEKLNSDYYWQLQGYMALTGAPIAKIAYCLSNAPAHLIKAEKMKIYYAMNCPEDGNPEYLKKCIEIEKNMIFDMKQFDRDNPWFDVDCKEWTYDIPIQERIIEFEVKRNNEDIEFMYERLKLCREFMNEFGKHQKERILSLAA